MRLLRERVFPTGLLMCWSSLVSQPRIFVIFGTRRDVSYISVYPRLSSCIRPPTSEGCLAPGATFRLPRDQPDGDRESINVFNLAPERRGPGRCLHHVI